MRMTGLQHVPSVAVHNSEDEGQLIMYSVLLLWLGCIMVEHKGLLCVRLPSEPGHIPELLLDTAVPLSEEAPDATPSPLTRDLPEDPINLHDQEGESFVPTAVAMILAGLR